MCQGQGTATLPFTIAQSYNALTREKARLPSPQPLPESLARFPQGRQSPNGTLMQKNAGAPKGPHSGNLGKPFGRDRPHSKPSPIGIIPDPKTLGSKVGKESLGFLPRPEIGFAAALGALDGHHLSALVEAFPAPCKGFALHGFADILAPMRIEPAACRVPVNRLFRSHFVPLGLGEAPSPH